MPPPYILTTLDDRGMTDRSRKKEETTDGTPSETEEVFEIKDGLEEAKELAEQYLDAARRIQADFDNYRKRSVKDMEDAKKRATDDLIAELLPSIDDLDRALCLVGEENDFILGIRGVRQNLMKTLESRGVKEIPTDCKFNPGLHEAMSTVEGEQDGDIAEVYQKGYLCDDRVLRYSKVKVTKASEEEDETAGETAKENKQE